MGLGGDAEGALELGYIARVNVIRIESYVAGLDLGTFAADDRTVDAAERCLQRITKAVIKIGPVGWQKYPPRRLWMRCAASATWLRHDYDRVDLGTIWRTIRESLPKLRADCVRVQG